ncbi:Fpg/Nei family DNA glycosylase [Streptomyces sp. 4N509B]|uniref:Fpg/Nei family DNA glycosylase n=1 Tax=Streptomyces sp. 4N509B TaxID=3457413 RepID=UPI003FD57E90
MPELPDVEGFRRVLAEYGQGRRIEGVDVADTGVLHGVTAPRLARELTGRHFTEPDRRGKWLLGHTDGGGGGGAGSARGGKGRDRDGGDGDGGDGDGGDGDGGDGDGGDGPTVMLHFGMTGTLVRESPDAPAHPHDRVTFTLDDDHQLRYRDQRKLQGLWLATSKEAVGRVIGDQGPDALALRGGELASALAGRRGRIKSTLVDQSVVAGLGNLLGDEILWRARVHPDRQTSHLSDDERRRLDASLRRVLRESVSAGYVPTRRSWLTGRRYDEDPRCPRCDGPLSRTRTAGRATTYCPRCQPA